MWGCRRICRIVGRNGFFEIQILAGGRQYGANARFCQSRDVYQNYFFISPFLNLEEHDICSPQSIIKSEDSLIIYLMAWNNQSPEARYHDPLILR
jgi:hypothetical protein